MNIDQLLESKHTLTKHVMDLRTIIMRAREGHDTYYRAGTWYAKADPAVLIEVAQAELAKTEEALIQIGRKVDAINELLGQTP